MLLTHYIEPGSPWQNVYGQRLFRDAAASFPGAPKTGKIGQNGITFAHHRAGNNFMHPKPIPDKLPGTVVAMRVTCGNPNCKCARGERHGPYFYRLYRDGCGKVRKAYVRPGDLAAVRAACDARREQERMARKVLRCGRAALKWFAEKHDTLPATEAEFQRADCAPRETRAGSVSRRGTRPPTGSASPS